MLYKTITLELLQQFPSADSAPPITLLDRYSDALKASHEAWKNLLARQRPPSAPDQVVSAALEMAIQELREHLKSKAQSNPDESLSLDQAMTFLRRRTSSKN